MAVCDQQRAAERCERISNVIWAHKTIKDAYDIDRIIIITR